MSLEEQSVFKASPREIVGRSCAIDRQSQSLPERSRGCKGRQGTKNMTEMASLGNGFKVLGTEQMDL